MMTEKLQKKIGGLEEKLQTALEQLETAAQKVAAETDQKLETAN